MTPIEFVDSNNDQRIAVDGTWRKDGSGALHLTASHVYLDTLQAAFDRPTRYGGIVDLDATLRGTRADPQASGTVTITNGRVERVSYQKLAGRFAYTGRRFDVDLRLDQSPGVWLTAVGTVPVGLFNAGGPDDPMDIAIKSSTISLGLIEGLTGVVRNVSGTLKIDVKAIGTSRDPHVEGTRRDRERGVPGRRERRDVQERARLAQPRARQGDGGVAAPRGRRRPGTRRPRLPGHA